MLDICYLTECSGQCVRREFWMTSLQHGWGDWSSGYWNHSPGLSPLLASDFLDLPPPLQGWESRAWPYPQVSDSVPGEWGLSIPTSDSFPGNADGAGPQTTFWKLVSLTLTPSQSRNKVFAKTRSLNAISFPAKLSGSTPASSLELQETHKILYTRPS